MTAGSSWIGSLVGLVGLLLVLGLSLVWLNIERVELAYDLKKMQTELDEKQAFSSKLEVERNNILSPYSLRALAKEYGLSEARAGQIRKLSAQERSAVSEDRK